MTDAEFTPSTAQVRELYTARRQDADMQPMGSGRFEFDRWLAAHDAEVWDEGAKAVAQFVADNAEAFQDFVTIRGRTVEFVGMFLTQFRAPNPYRVKTETREQ